MASCKDEAVGFVIPGGIPIEEGGVFLPKRPPNEGDPTDAGGVDLCRVGIVRCDGEDLILGVDDGVSRCVFESSDSSSSSSE